jgi:hypothetical protein
MISKIDKTAILRREILNQYGSVRKFAGVAGITYSTLTSALERGIEGMAYSSVIKMCDILGLNPVDFSRLGSGMVGDILLKEKVLNKYIKLNDAGQDKVLDYMDDLLLVKKYKR